MRAGLRLGIAALAGALTLAPPTAHAQEAPPAATNTTTSPPSETIGPRELENFSLNGTVTRPAPTPPARTTPPEVTQPPAGRDQPAAASRERAAPPTPERARPATSTAPAVPPSAIVPDGPIVPAIEDTSVQPDLEPAPMAEVAEGGNSTIYPWLLALAVLAGGVGLFFWRQRSQPRYATAGAAPQAYAAPEPAIEPRTLPRAPAPGPAPTSPMPSGIVATRLRPWLEIEFTPGRCVLEEDKATIQFDVAVYNSGAAPARDVLIEASMFNAGPTQDDEIRAFFARPAAKGDRIPAIPPLKRVALKSAVTLSREQMRQFEVEGRRLFVPLIGFNALYRWGGGDGQTSASYLVGRDRNSDRMAPLRLDLGPRIFRGLGARQHTVGVRK